METSKDSSRKRKPKKKVILVKMVSASVEPKIDCIGFELKARANSDVPLCISTTTIRSNATTISRLNKIV